MPTETEQCFRMEPPRRWMGLWRNEFEGSRFCPAPASRCDFGAPGDDIWLDTRRATKREPDGALYAVELIGRRTAFRGHHGHMGGSNLELIVDRFISIKEVGPPQTVSEQRAAFKRCMQDKQCRSWNR
jgi:hypothetical protein